VTLNASGQILPELSFLYRQISEKMNKKRASKFKTSCSPKWQKPKISAPGKRRWRKMEKIFIKNNMSEIHFKGNLKIAAREFRTSKSHAKSNSDVYKGKSFFLFLGG
jgi:hypothetical protein